MQNNIDDYTLIQSCLDGDQEAFQELVARYKNLVYSVILRMVQNMEDANDLAQEVFIKVYKNLDKYKPEYKFSTWIIRIATNHVIDYRRKKRLETVHIDDMTNEPFTSDTPENILIRKDASRRVTDALNALPDMYKLPMILYHQKGFSYQDIADSIGEPLSKVKNRIFRARKMLKDSLLKLEEGGHNDAL